jgi:hypothetical protein
VVPMLLGAVLLLVCAVLCLYGGIGGQPRDGGHALRTVTRDRLHGPLLVMGVTLLFGACLAVGDAVSDHGTKSNVGLVLMAIGGAGLITGALLFASLRLFGRPKSLMPRQTRGGVLAGRHGGPER